MPRFYFHITHDDPHVDDTEGIDLPDRKAAWEEATRSCGEMLAEIDGDLSMGKDWVMEVHDNQGPVFRVHFGAEAAAASSDERRSFDAIVNSLRDVQRVVSQSPFAGPLADLQSLLSVAVSEAVGVRSKLGHQQAARPSPVGRSLLRAGEPQ